MALLYEGRTSDWPTYRSWLRQPRFLSNLDNLPWVTLSAAILLRVQQLLDTARPPLLGPFTGTITTYQLN